LRFCRPSIPIVGLGSSDPGSVVDIVESGLLDPSVGISFRFDPVAGTFGRLDSSDTGSDPVSIVVGSELFKILFDPDVCIPKFVVVSFRFGPVVGISFRFDPAVGISFRFDPAVGISFKFDPAVGISFKFDPAVGISFRFGPVVGISFRFGPVVGISFRFDPVVGISFRFGPVVGISFRFDPAVGVSKFIDVSFDTLCTIVVGIIDDTDVGIIDDTDVGIIDCTDVGIVGIIVVGIVGIIVVGIVDPDDLLPPVTLVEEPLLPPIESNLR